MSCAAIINAVTLWDRFGHVRTKAGKRIAVRTGQYNTYFTGFFGKLGGEKGQALRLDDTCACFCH